MRKRVYGCDIPPYPSFYQHITSRTPFKKGCKGCDKGVTSITDQNVTPLLHPSHPAERVYRPVFIGDVTPVHPFFDFLYNYGHLSINRGGFWKNLVDIFSKTNEIFRPLPARYLWRDNSPEPRTIYEPRIA